MKMNLRKAHDYSIGLDLGTGSVGWAVVGPDGKPYSFGRGRTLGSRVFPSAEPASTARAPRGQRRRYVRRRWRIDLLQRFFAPAMEQVDKDFFLRLNQSRLVKADKDPSLSSYAWPLFNDPGFTEKDYYKRFPTIYHLRAYLCESDEQADLRLVYLALHNIVKCRGNFLYQDNPSLSATDASVDDAVERLAASLADWCEERDVQIDCDVAGLLAAFSDPTLRRGEKRDLIKAMFGFDSGYQKALGKEVASAMLGYKANFSKMLSIEDGTYSFSLGNDEKVEEFLAVCPDEDLTLFEALRTAYSAYLLSGILRDADGKTISFCKVREYEQYAKDLRVLKDMFKQYAPERYKSFFGGEYLVVNGVVLAKRYDPAKAEGYTKYDLVHNATAYDDLKKAVAKELGAAASEDPRYIKMMESFDEGRFLRRLKTSDNGSIPYQLHLEEMRGIIARQGRFYPFLVEDAEKIESLVSFRIPYYVGPLTTKGAAKDRHGNMRFAWSVRKEGMENETVLPWNWEEVIDKNKSAELFIRRMTGTCTYLQGEPVLPKCSLLYEEFCVLNELNGAHWTADGDREYRFDLRDRQGLVRDLFRKKKVAYKDVMDWMRRHGNRCVQVSGGQGESGFESRMATYIFFSKDILHVDEIDAADYPMIEEIVLWNTLFEDRSILRERIAEKYGDRLDAGQIKRICKKRFTGWGRLSKKLLTGVKVETDQGRCSIMDVLRDGHPNGDRRSRAMVFMEVLRDDALGFQKKVDELNEDKVAEGGLCIEDLPGSSALRRSINQAMRIVEEIVHIAKRPPANIFIEVTRDEDARGKGRRSVRRYDSIKRALENLKEDCPRWYDEGVLGELEGMSPEDLDERLTLYFMQNGKSLYSGKPLKIEQLSSPQYQVDHIIPRSYIKDDSFDNKALVLSEENQWKSDSLLIDRNVRQKMAPSWRALHDAGLISDKKFNNLMRSHISDEKIRGFIARQLVETSQVVKLAAMMLRAKYPETSVQPVKSALSANLRSAAHFFKCREVNDFHHAHDALLACGLGRYIQTILPGIYDNPIGYAHAVKEAVRRQKEDLSKRGRMPGGSGFIVDGFMRTHVNEETGEVLWDAAAELVQIRSCLDYSNIFVTRMPEETSGAYWNATIYSPYYGKTTPTLRLKRGLDVSRYGGFSSESFAYFALYSGVKGNKRRVELIGIPVTIARSIERQPKVLDDLVGSDAKAKGIDHPSILRRRILKYSRFDFGTDQYYLAALDAVYSARQLVLDGDMQKVAAAACDEKTKDESIEGASLLRLYDALVEKGGVLCSKYLNVTSALSKGRERFEELSTAGKRKLIKNVLNFYRSSTARVDLTLIGGPKNAGMIRRTTVLAPGSSIDFVDQSITGMFEKRTTIEL